MKLILPLSKKPQGLIRSRDAIMSLQRHLEWLEGGSLAARFPRILHQNDYLMSLFSQIAYVPTRFEASNARATKVVPSTFFQEQARLGRSVDIALLVHQAFPEADEIAVRRVTTGNSVTTLIRMRNVVVIASRGTSLFHELLNPIKDLIIDLNAWHIPYRDPRYRYHFGFLEEACAALPHVRAAYDELGSSLPIYFTGHSLGGVLSALMDRLWDDERPPGAIRRAVVFGCPRFGNLNAVRLRPLRAIERLGDPIPTLPPTFFGYADPNCRVPVTGPDRRSRLNPFKNHAMERYRRAIADRDGFLADDAALYRLFEIAMTKDAKNWGF